MEKFATNLWFCPMENPIVEWKIWPPNSTSIPDANFDYYYLLSHFLIQIQYIIYRNHNERRNTSMYHMMVAPYFSNACCHSKSHHGNLKRKIKGLLQFCGTNCNSWENYRWPITQEADEPMLAISQNKIPQLINASLEFSIITSLGNNFLE